jgi:hypothetical protein
VTSTALVHEFVSRVPREIEPSTLYVSIQYATAVHLCPGCGRKVVTPFAPGSWYLIFDGEAVSIRPSIRNRAHECRSHYWIDRDRIVPAFDDLEEQRGDGRRSGARLPIVEAPTTWVDRLRQRLHRVAARVRLER